MQHFKPYDTATGKEVHVKDNAEMDGGVFVPRRGVVMCCYVDKPCHFHQANPDEVKPIPADMWITVRVYREDVENIRQIINATGSINIEELPPRKRKARQKQLDMAHQWLTSMTKSLDKYSEEKS